LSTFTPAWLIKICATLLDLITDRSKLDL
jgi:hypothetical protein